MFIKFHLLLWLLDSDFVCSEIYTTQTLHVLFFVFLGPHTENMEVPRLGDELELQLQVYTTGTATLDPSQVCKLQYSSQKCWILNPLSKARD